jgi:hypothetical protein
VVTRPVVTAPPEVASANEPGVQAAHSNADVKQNNRFMPTSVWVLDEKSLKRGRLERVPLQSSFTIGP